MDSVVLIRHSALKWIEVMYLSEFFRIAYFDIGAKLWGNYMIVPVPVK